MIQTKGGQQMQMQQQQIMQIPTQRKMRIQKLFTQLGQTVVTYKPICATLEMIRTELVAKSRPTVVKLFEYSNPG